MVTSGQEARVVGRQDLRRFSIGYSSECSPEEHFRILDEFAPFIAEIYFSPPFGDRFHTRPEDVWNLATVEGADNLWRVLGRAKQRGVKLCASFNAYRLRPGDVRDALRRMSGIVDIDACTTLLRYAAVIREARPDLVIAASYNEVIDSAEAVDAIPEGLVDMIVPGRSALRNFRLFSYIGGCGIRAKVLLNNGCSFYCSTCKCRGCYRFNPRFELYEEIEGYGPDQLYALQSLMPWELHGRGYLDHPDIALFKVSNRPCTYDYLRCCLLSYTANLNLEMRPIYERPDDFRSRIYHLWCRGNLLPPLFRRLDYDRVMDFKNVIWSEGRLRHFGRPRG